MSYLLSERHFHRNLAYVAQVTKAYPQTVTFDVKPPITQADVLARNIRYAGKSLQLSQWRVGSNQLDYPKFVQVWDDVVISPTVHPGKVVCGPESVVRAMARNLPGTVNPIEGAPEQLVPKVELEHPSMELIIAVLIFHHHRFLTEQSRITSELNIQSIAEPYDVAIQRDGDTYTIL